MSGSPVDLQAHVRCANGAVTLDYGAAVYNLALLDVLAKLAEGRYGAPPRHPFTAFKDALDRAARELAAPGPAGTCAAASDDDKPPTLVSEPTMSTREAAELLEITTSGVTHLVRHGRLEATRFGRAWAISATSVAAYRASRRRKDVA